MLERRGRLLPGRGNGLDHYPDHRHPPDGGHVRHGPPDRTTGSNYDKSRALANLKLEEAKSLPFATLQNDFPVASSTPDATTGYYDSGFIPASAPYTNFQYRIEKQYMKKPVTTSTEFEQCDAIPNTCSTDTNLIRVTVTVQWADGNEYHTLGLVSA